MGKVSIDIPLLIQRLLQIFGLVQSCLDLRTLNFCLIQVINQSLVFQNVALRLGKLFEQLLFVSGQLDLESLFLLEKLSFPTLEFWLLKVDRDGEKLTLETTLCNCEVDIIHKRLRVGRNVNELISGCQVHLETCIIIHCLIADLNNLTRSLLIEILPENREEDRLDSVDLLNDESLTESDRQLENRVELPILVIEDFEALFLLSERLLEPLCSLGGGINDQRSPYCVEDYDGIFH